MRVYELAKKLGMENKDLIPELKKMGVPVASHSSALDDDTVPEKPVMALTAAATLALVRDRPPLPRTAD